MKKLCLFITLMLLSLGATAEQEGDWANFERYQNANKNVRLGARAVFMGNSITQGWYGTHPDFFAINNYIGRGISGQVTSQMLVRFRADVVALQPKSVVILAGTNDIARNQGYISLPNIMGNIQSMCEVAKAHNIKVILCSVLPVYKYGWNSELPSPADEIVELNEMIKRYATEKNYAYVDFHSKMKNSQGGLPTKYAQDGVHPTSEGYKLMEAIIQPVIERVVGGNEP